jgi:hypothetical protein
MKTLFVFISFGLMAIALCAGYFLTDKFWEAVAINAGTSFMTMGVALIFINIYLERNARRGAVKSLLILSQKSIVQFNNTLLDLCWAKFGRDEWGKIGQEYLNSNGKPESLRQDVRSFLYELAKTNTDFKDKLDKMLDTLTELSRLVGWDLDANLLESCLNSRISIGRLKEINYNDSEDAKKDATEHIMDTQIRSNDTLDLLKTLAGIQ